MDDKFSWLSSKIVCDAVIVEEILCLDLLQCQTTSFGMWIFACHDKKSSLKFQKEYKQKKWKRTLYLYSILAQNQL